MSRSTGSFLRTEINRNENNKMDETRIRELALFSSLPAGEIDFLLNSSRIAVYSPGAILFSEGDASDRFSDGSRGPA